MADVILAQLNGLGINNLVDDELFENFAEIKPSDTKIEDYNLCRDCGCAMNLSGVEYQCPKCGIIKQLIGDNIGTNLDETTGSANLRISASGRGRFYNIISDYMRARRLLILQQLMSNNATYAGPKFQKDILAKAANVYNDIQKLIIPGEEEEDKPKRGGKKFVKRGNIKDEVLTALVHYECIRAGVPRKKKDVAEFMKLQTNGFSRGEDIVRSFAAEGLIDIPIDDEPTEFFVDRYLEGLNLEDEKYKNFVKELIDRSESLRIGMNSQISSKYAGAIWILITHKKINLSIAEVERACDSCKKNTFQRFCQAVNDNMPLFGDIFDKYEVPRGFKK